MNPGDISACGRGHPRFHCVFAGGAAVSADAGFEWEGIPGFPGLDLPGDAEVTELAKTLATANRTSKVSFGTEAGLFHGAGIPAVVCGPGRIAQAHTADEYIALEQVARCENFISRLIERLAET